MNHLFLRQQLGSKSSQFKITEYLKTQHQLVFDEQIASESDTNVIWFVTTRSERDRELIQDIFEDIRQIRYEGHDLDTLAVEFTEIINVIPRRQSLIKYMLRNLDIPHMCKSVTRNKITKHSIRTMTSEDMLAILSWLETLPLMAVVEIQGDTLAR